MAPTPRSILIPYLHTCEVVCCSGAGTVILAITIIIWALSYYPRSPELAAEFDRRESEIRNRTICPMPLFKTSP